MCRKGAFLDTVHSVSAYAFSDFSRMNRVLRQKLHTCICTLVPKRFLKKMNHIGDMRVLKNPVFLEMTSQTVILLHKMVTKSKKVKKKSYFGENVRLTTYAGKYLGYQGSSGYGWQIVRFPQNMIFFYFFILFFYHHFWCNLQNKVIF